MSKAEHHEFLIEICREFLTLIDNGGRDSNEDEQFLKELLSRLSLAIVNLTRPAEWDSDNRYQSPHQIELRELIEARFPRYGYYNSVNPIVEDVGDGTPTVGDAIDDILDIYNELHQSVWASEHLGPQEGVEHLIASYYGHWGRHLRNLQLYLYELDNAP